MIYTTLNKIRKHSPCKDSWKRLLAYLGKTAADDEPLAMSVILKSNGLGDAIWCLRIVPEESKRWRRLAVKFARTVQHRMKDRRSLDVLDVAERHADGLATDEELAAAREAAMDAAYGAAYGAASHAAYSAARHEAWVAVSTTAGDVAMSTAASDAAWNAAWNAAWKEMSRLFLDCLEGDA